MNKLKVLDLFTGIGGFSLGLEQTNHYETIAFCENDKNCQKVLKKHWPNIPIFNNICHLTKESLKNFEIDLITGGFPCFGKGTLILTKTGFKPIEEIQIGEKVLTHLGRWKKVLDKHITFNRKTKMMKGHGFLNTSITEEHPIYCVEKHQKWNDAKRTLEKKFTEPIWVTVKDIKSKIHFAGQVLPEIKELPGDENFWWIVGRYLADGWLVNRKDRGNGESCRVVICCGKHKEKELEEKIKKSFNYSKVEERTTFKFHITKNVFGEFLKPAKRGAKNKEIPPEWFHLPKNKAKALLEGYFSGDGSKQLNRYRATSVSPKLILGISLLIQRVYDVCASIYEQDVPEKTIIEGREVNQSKQYIVAYSERTNGTKSYCIGSYGWKPIKSIEENKFETVFNIEVEEDQSYFANGIIVHNCQDISFAGRQNGIVKGKRSSLWKEYWRIINEIRPKYAIIENVEYLRKNGLGFVLNDLARIGYDAEWTCITANSVGFPHQRKRLFIISYPCRKRYDEYIGEKGYLQINEEWKNTSMDSNGQQCESESIQVRPILSRGAFENFRNTSTDRRTSISKLRRITDGIPNELDESKRKIRIKQLGNAIVPEIARIAGEAIYHHYINNGA